MRKVGVIGPTDVLALAALLSELGKPPVSVEWLLSKAAQIGAILARHADELWIAADGGMLAVVATSYKQAGGKKLVVLVPEKPDPWPIEHTERYTAIADEVLKTADWYRANHELVSETDVVICVGLSAGTFTELGYIRWDDQFAQSKLRALVAIKELLRDGMLPPELTTKISQQLIRYAATVDGLDRVLGDVGPNMPLPLNM